MRTSRILTAAAAAAALTLAGCSSDVEGTAVDSETAALAADSGAERQADFDIESLDTGGYNTVPKDFEAEGRLAGDFGPAVEGQRMAEFVVAPYTIDPKLVSGGGMNQGVGVGGLAKLGLLSESVSAISEKYEVITTFSDFQDYADGSHGLGISVVRLPDEASAAAIADELYADELTDGSGGDDIFASGAGTPITLPGLPDTKAVTFRWETGSDTVSSYTVNGPHFIYTYATTTPDDPEWAKDITTRALEKQIPLLAGFPYTPTPEIPELVVDMDKVLARAVGYTEDETTRNSELAVYGPLGWLHFDSNPAQTAELFEKTGTDRVAMANSTVYRTASPEGAETVRDAFLAQTRRNYSEVTEDASAPQNVPDTTCMSGDVAEGRMSVCYMTYGPYVAEITGFRPIGNTDPERDSLRTMSQRVATQYVKFVEAEEMGLGKN